MKDYEFKMSLAHQLECIAVYKPCKHVVSKYAQWLYKRICCVSKKQHWNQQMLLFAVIENLKLNGNIDLFLRKR